MNRKKGGMFLPFSVLFLILSLVALFDIGRYNFEVERNLLIDNGESTVLDITCEDAMKIVAISNVTGKDLEIELNGYDLKTFYDSGVHKWKIKVEKGSFSKVFVSPR
jgi:hypothetical protein